MLPSSGDPRKLCGKRKSLPRPVAWPPASRTKSIIRSKRSRTSSTWRRKQPVKRGKVFEAGRPGTRPDRANHQEYSWVSIVTVSPPSEVDIAEVLEEVLAALWQKTAVQENRAPHRLGRGESKSSDIRAKYGKSLPISIANAIEALSDGGFSDDSHVQGPIWNGSRQQGVRITFLDNGTAVSPRQTKRKFSSRSITTKKDVGTGLGLWLTLNLVTKHHGSLRVRSSVQPGRTWTAFSVFLPDDTSKG